jgi:energy-coupling factor transport system ATP-binding protein
MIRINRLTYRYPNTTQPILIDVNLEIPSGTITLVSGASGSGKSTLLRCINGIVPHFTGGFIQGEIRVFEQNPIQSGPQKLAGLVGYVFQEPESQFVFDVVEAEIAFSLENAGVDQLEMNKRFNQIIDHFQLNSIRYKHIQEISGGEKQKVAIASAIVNHPRVLIFDEPTSQLDAQTAEEFMQFLVNLTTRFGLTTLIAEHRLERVLPFVDAIAHITQDHHVIFGPPRKILPRLDLVPPIVRIAQSFNISPLPLSVGEFPNKFTKLIKNKYPIETEDSPVDTDPILQLNQLSTNIHDQNILKDISFNLNQSEILVVLGPNGAGKTTLLRSILGLIPSEGKRELFSNNMEQMKISSIIKHISYLPQNPNDLLFADSIIEELKITLKNHHQRRSDTQMIEFLEPLGLAKQYNRYPRDLSIGECQRTAIAAITIHDPEIILLDEPTRGLDYHSKLKLSSLLKNWRNQGKSIIVVTHDVEFAARLADRVLIIENGKMLFIGHPRVAFTQFEMYQPQTTRLFPQTNAIIPEDILSDEPNGS